MSEERSRSSMIFFADFPKLRIWTEFQTTIINYQLECKLSPCLSPVLTAHDHVLATV